MDQGLVWATVWIGSGKAIETMAEREAVAEDV